MLAYAAAGMPAKFQLMNFDLRERPQHQRWRAVPPMMVAGPDFGCQIRASDCACGTMMHVAVLPQTPTGIFGNLKVEELRRSVEALRADLSVRLSLQAKCWQIRLCYKQQCLLRSMYMHSDAPVETLCRFAQECYSPCVAASS